VQGGGGGGCCQLYAQCDLHVCACVLVKGGKGSLGVQVLACLRLNANV